jgi:hypothetical protein
MDTVLEGLAANPALPAPLLDRLVAVADDVVSLELAQRPDLTPFHVRVLLARSAAVVSVLLSSGRVSPADVPTSDPWVALAVATHPDASPSVARALAVHPDPAVRVHLAACPLPADVVLRLLQDSAAEVVAEVLCFYPVPAGLAAKLSTHPRVEVRRALAGNEHTPAPVLSRLSADEQCAYPLVTNAATPVPVLMDLMGNPWMRLWLAERPDLPASAYRELATDEPRVRAKLAANPAVPADVLAALAGSHCDDLLRNPAIPLGLLASVTATARVQPFLVPRVAAASEAELRVLASSVTTRRFVAERQDLPADVVRHLADDPDPAVVAAIVRNPAVPAAQLRELVERHGPRLYPCAARNPGCPADLLHHMALHASTDETHRAIAEHPNASGETLLLCLEDHRARHSAARHPRLPGWKIVELLADEFTARPAASNPSLPVPVMEKLLGR